MSHKLRLLALIAAAAAVGFEGAAAQGLRRVGDDDEWRRSLFGINGELMRPVGEFQNFVDWGGGLGMYGVINLGRTPVGIRIDGAWSIYGHESFYQPLSPTFPRISVEVETDNMIGQFGIGPQLTLGRGAVRPYAFGLMGLSYFATVSKVRGSGSHEPFASTTNFDDVTGALTAGTGFLVELSRGKKHPLSLDMGVRMTRNGEATYLRPGSILDSPDGTLTFLPIRSEANHVNVRLGIAIGI